VYKNGDANPSLGAKGGANSRPLFFCPAGRDFRDIVAALEREGILPRRRLLALEHTVRYCRDRRNCNIKTAKAAMLSTIERASSSPGAPAR
jgi:hypothetical protein